MSEITPPLLPTLPQSLAERTAVARQSLKTESAKLKRLLQNLAQDQARADQAEALRLAGEVLKGQLAQVPRGASSWSGPVPWQPEQQITVALRPELSAAENVAKMFQRARGLATGSRIIAERRQATEQRLLVLASVQLGYPPLLERAQRWQQTSPQDRESLGDRPRNLFRDADTWLQSVRALRLKIGGEHKPDVQQRQIARKAGAELPKGVELFRSPEGRAVLVGRSAEGNDALVTRLLRGRDVWLHVRDQTGAHVVLRSEGQTAPSEAEVRACAILAAHLSGLAKGDRAEVAVCAGKGVKKVKGAPTGSVYVSGERAVRVTIDAAVVDAFYARRPPK
jgi:predicted ribosome quality control (RQC) complex YloA/Tae2 family protein